MLQHLDIKNYALIDHVELDFTPGLTIVTGETGAGKSIMMGALSLLTGSRADSKAIADGDRKAVVEAEFSNVAGELEHVFAANALDWTPGSVILRREISTSGRSRAFVNDTPVGVAVLAEIASYLIDIHSQNSNIQLSLPGRQLDTLDQYASCYALLDDYKQCFSDFVKARREIATLKENIKNAAQNRDFIAFQLEQLDKLKPKPGELETVEREFELLSEADDIREKLSEAYARLQESDYSALNSISASAQLLESSGLNITGEEEGVALAQRLHTLEIDLKDIAETVSDYLDTVHADPSKLSKLSSRMNQLYEAQKHFKVKSHEELVELHESLKRKLLTLDAGDDNLAELEANARQLARQLKQKADLLSAARAEAAPKFAEAVVEAARPLGLPNLQLEVEMRHGKLTSEGQESVEFLCSFNKNRPMQPIASVASGGEIARVMLALKSVMASKAGLSTVVFDEIDTGVSGEIASHMGHMMHRLGERMQVLAITHLPQVAACGDSHFKVYKSDEEQKTVTHVRRLSQREREQEIAAMLSGSEVNKAALSNARSLIREKQHKYM